MSARVICSMLALSSLVACANVNDIRKKDPVIFGTTQKTAAQYADCVTNAWRADGEKVSRIEIANGFDVVTSGYTNVNTVLRVQHYDNQTHFTMSSRTQYGIQPLVDRANLCM